MVNVIGDSVEFTFFRPEASQVHLAGDFNGWQENSLPMTPSGNGYWTAIVSLPAGEFKFRYCADGEWFTDYAAFGVEPGRFGLDSIVRVPHKTLQIVPQTLVAAGDTAAA